MPLSISAITPSYNQAEFLPRALASVASQSLRPVEHIVFDPGSTDASREIARNAAGVTLVAEPDKGQADAVASGMLRAKGDIIAWLNSDDEYHDADVFAAVIDAFASQAAPDIVYGDGDYVGKEGEFLRPAYVIRDASELPWRLAKEVGILQPATFISKTLIERIGAVDRDLQFCMDYEFWIRAQQSGAKFMRLDRPLAKARYYADNKTLGQRAESLQEVIGMVKRRFGFVHPEWIKRLADYQLNKHDGILSNFANSSHDAAALEAATKELCRRINGDILTTERIAAIHGDMHLEGLAKSASACAGAAQASAYAKRLDEGSPPPAQSQTYTVGPQRWGFDKSWLSLQLDRSDSIFERLRAERKSNVCVIVGNGPSLKATNLDLLQGADVFVTNYAFLDRKLASVARYLCVTNYLVAEQAPESFNLISNVMKFAPYWLSYCLLPTDDTCYVRSVGHAEFGTDYRVNISWRSTVSFFAMQIAYALGYRKVILVGFDHSYVQPKSQEGDLIEQKEDDPNHFDSRYFKGKVWQAADTDNMEAMYGLAKAAFEADDREIVNCTVGGRLEVFRRGDLGAELNKAPTRLEYPRVLLIDHTRVGDGTATGELKGTLFANWPKDRLLQLFDATGGKIGVRAASGLSTVNAAEYGEMWALHQRVVEFAPCIVVYRPVPRTETLHLAAMDLISRLEVPVASWIMDDWPSTISSDSAPAAATLTDDWRALLARSRLALCIGDAMAASFAQRYGQSFLPIANGITPSDWGPAELRPRGAPIKVRYAGALAENMSLATLCLVAEAVDRLVEAGVDIEFEIKTREWWQRVAGPSLARYANTRLTASNLTPSEYRSWLAEADIVVIGYNFDAKSLEYTRYSVANKLPECLASGAALLAIGSHEIATMAQLEQLGCGVCITSPDIVRLQDALGELAASPEMRLTLAQKAQKIAFELFDIRKIRSKFASALSEAAFADFTSGAPRMARARVDESAAVARLLRNRRGAEHVVVKLSAAAGAASSDPFQQLGWTVQRVSRAAAKTPATIGRASQSSGSLQGAGATQRDTQVLRPPNDADEDPSLDDIMRTLASYPRVDFLQIERESMGAPVLESLRRSPSRPDVIECAFGSRADPLGGTRKHAVALLKDQGYSVYVSEWHPMNDADARRDWRRVVPAEGAETPPHAWGKILAFDEDPGLPALLTAFKEVMPPLASLATGEQVRSVAVGPDVPPQSRFYAKYADDLRLRSPKLFWALRTAKKMGGSIWRRRVVALPALALLAVWVLIGFLPAAAPLRWLIWGAGAFAFLLGAIAYVAWRTRTFMERFAGETFVLRQSLEFARQDLHRANERISTLTTAHSAAAAMAAKNAKALAAAQGQARKLAADLSSQTDALNRQADAVARLEEDHADRIASVQAALSDYASASEAKIAENQTQISASTEATAAIAQRLGALEAARENTAREIAAQGQRLSRTDKSSTFNNAMWYQRFNRRLNQDHVTALMRWTENLRIQVTQQTIGYAANRACVLENRMQGRLATSVENMLLRIYVAMGVKRRSLDVLEIGTLFGVGAAIMYDALAPHFDDVHITLLDPLDGYYETRKLDILTGQPVSETTLRRNLMEVGLTEENLTLIKLLSSDPKAIEMASARQYDVLVIDGDHTYAGVKTDFDLYAPLVRSGGMIIFDDYGSEEWPDVQRYVDEQVEPLDIVDRVGHEWRTCVYRVK